MSVKLGGIYFKFSYFCYNISKYYMYPHNNKNQRSLTVYITKFDFWATRRVRTTSNGYDVRVAAEAATMPHIKWAVDVWFNSFSFIDKYSRDFWNTKNLRTIKNYIYI